MSTDLEVRPDIAPVPASPGLFGTDKPGEVIARAKKVATLLKDVVNQQGLVKNIGGKEYILAEGWTTLGAMVGVFPKVEYSKPIHDTDGNKIGWEAAVEVVNQQGIVIGRAEAECLRDERNWKGRDDFALRSMAQTRAMGKALRMPLGFIASLAGYQATPAEEMPDEVDVPFESGPASTADAGGAGTSGGAEAHTSSGSAGAQQANAAGDAASTLADRLVELGVELGAGPATREAVDANRVKYAADPGKHVAWLERQIRTAEKNVEQKRVAV